MNHVELVPGIRSSVIGFGCGPMMGSVGRESSWQALSLAFDLGVTHFDTAASYGYGESEKLLGEFLVGKRDRAVIATKYGIEVKPAAIILRPLKSTVRTLLKTVRRGRVSGSGTSGPGGQLGVNLHRHVLISAKGLEKSVERSLRRLRTDYLDYLFLHSPAEALEQPEEVFSTVARLKEAGKVKSFGLASYIKDLPAHGRDLNRFDMLQLECPADNEKYEEIRATRGSVPTILFSPFSARRSDGSESHTDVLRRIQRDFSRSVILCSMYRESSIRANCAVG